MNKIYLSKKPEFQTLKNPDCLKAQLFFKYLYGNPVLKMRIDFSMFNYILVIDMKLYKLKKLELDFHILIDGISETIAKLFKFI